MQYFQNQRQQHSTLALSTFSASPPILLLPHTNSCVKLHVHVCVCYLGGLYALNYRFKTIFKNLECSHPSLPPSSTPETHIWFCSKTKLSFCSRYLLHTPAAFLPFSPTDFEIFCMVLPWVSLESMQNRSKGWRATLLFACIKHLAHLKFTTAASW